MSRTRPRIIPVLLLSDRGLVKSTGFARHRYIGDPLNAARIFSEMGADELILLDIDATRSGRPISYQTVERIADEISMPLAVGGGITSVETAAKLIESGAEKIVLGTAAWTDTYLIKEAAERFGSSAVSVCIDAKRDANGKATAHVVNATRDTKISPAELALVVAEHGAGEIILQSVDNDGRMAGYDIPLVAEVAGAVSIPVVALGGAGCAEHMSRVVDEGFASAAAAGSSFVYHGRLNGVLINYPDRSEVLFC